jgi:hypothetical protein
LMFLHREPKFCPIFLRLNIPFSALLPITLIFCASVGVRDQVSHPHKTTRKL